LCAINKDRRLYARIQDINPGETSIGKYVMAAVFATILIPPLTYFHWFVNPGFDVYFFHFSESRVALAIAGVTITLAIPFLIGGFVHFIIRFYLGLKYH